MLKAQRLNPLIACTCAWQSR